MLSIVDTANSNGVPEIGTDFLVSSIEIINDQTLKVYFTRPAVNADNFANYTIQGPSFRKVTLAQYSSKSATLYLDSPLTVGQWTLSLNEFVPTPGKLVVDITGLTDGLYPAAGAYPVSLALRSVIEANSSITVVSASIPDDNHFQFGWLWPLNGGVGNQPITSHVTSLEFYTQDFSGGDSVTRAQGSITTCQPSEIVNFDWLEVPDGRGGFIYPEFKRNAVSLYPIKSDDFDSIVLPSGSRIVFDLVDKSTNDTIGSNLNEGVVSKFIPKEYRNKNVYAAIIAGLEAGDAIVSEQARLAFDQYFLSTASESYLNTRAGDRGITNPVNLNISDEDFREFAINISNSKLTNESMLSLLETLYGQDSVRGYVETLSTGPWAIFDKGYFDILIDGSQAFHLVINWTDYQNPLRATATELVAAFNFAFDKNQINAYAEVNQNKIRIYSKAKGLKSSIAITGGTLQPYLQFENTIYPTFTEDQLLPLIWDISNPRVGVVRFTPQDASVIKFISPALKVGDYVTIIGSNFPLALRGSWPVIAVNYVVGLSTPSEWFEIESDYIDPPPM